MKRKRHSEEQIVYALRQGESGTPVKEICRQMGVTETTYYTWKKRYAGMGMTELRQMKQMEEEIRHLKRLVLMASKWETRFRTFSSVRSRSFFEKWDCASWSRTYLNPDSTATMPPLSS